MSKQLVLLHGSGGNGNVFWFPYLKNHFSKQGWEIFSPDLPRSGKPVLGDWIEVVLAGLRPDSDIVFVSHSLGCPLVMSVLQRINYPTAKAILVAGLYQRQKFKHLNFLEEYNWSKIQSNCKEFFFIHSDNDPWDCGEAEADFALAFVSGKKIVIPGQGHFGSGTFKQEYPEFPMLISLIEEKTI